MIDLIFMVWVVWMRVYVVISVHIWFIVHFLFYRFFAGYFCVLIGKWLIINAIHFSVVQAFAGGFCGGVGGNVCFDNRDIIS